MAGRRNYSAELRRALDKDAVIECAMAPWEGTEVSYAPRVKGDPYPWVLSSEFTADYRYTGRECRIRRDRERESHERGE